MHFRSPCLDALCLEPSNEFGPRVHARSDQGVSSVSILLRLLLVSGCCLWLPDVEAYGRKVLPLELPPFPVLSALLHAGTGLASSRWLFRSFCSHVKARWSTLSMDAFSVVREAALGQDFFREHLDSLVSSDNCRRQEGQGAGEVRPHCLLIY